MNPKSGKAGSPISPSEPKKAAAAANDKAGDVSAAQAKQNDPNSGDFGSADVGGNGGGGAPETPHQPPVTDEEKAVKTSWIEIKLVDMEDRPVAGEAYKIILPDSSVASGTTDDKGLAKVEGFEPGTCKIQFPNIDKDAWEDA